MLENEDPRSVIVVECRGDLVRDPTSYGYQWSVHLSADEYKIIEEFRKRENKAVRVRIELEPIHEAGKN